ncbi:MAG: leucine-rich repeat domain-containing protein [Holosporales bacterium]|jgi:hypothetical protein|nr:leucine-rich repeat domain-containing protein [Holosporales bacterium]
MQKHLSKILFGESICSKHTFYALSLGIVASSSAFTTTAFKASIDVAKGAMDNTASLIRSGPQKSTNFTGAVAENVDAVKKFLDDVFVTVQRTMIPLEYIKLGYIWPEFLEFLIEEQQTVESLREQSNALVLLNETNMPATPTLANIEHLYLVKNYPTFDITACSKLKTLCFFDGPGLNADQRTAISTLVRNTKKLQKLIIMNWSDNTMATSAFERDDQLGSLISIVISGITSIGFRAFRLCSTLTTVLLPSSETLLGLAFADCHSLTFISCPEVKIIGEKDDIWGVFQACYNLETALFPKATIIGKSTFSGCTKLQTVSYKSDATIGTDAFKECPSTLQKILVP